MNKFITSTTNLITDCNRSKEMKRTKKKNKIEDENARYNIRLTPPVTVDLCTFTIIN